MMPDLNLVYGDPRRALEIAIDGFPGGYQPYIHGKVLEPTVTPIHVYIICDAAGSPAVSANTVNAWVAEANRIYRQAAMSFTVAGVHYVESPLWFRISNDTEFYDMCSYTNVTEGLELYCVSDITYAVGLHSDPTLMPSDSRCGMAVREKTGDRETVSRHVKTWQSGPSEEKTGDRETVSRYGSLARVRGRMCVILR